jgi:hypothetical protein
MQEPDRRSVYLLFRGGVAFHADPKVEKSI